MNEAQKKIIIAACILILIVVAFPPIASNYYGLRFRFIGDLGFGKMVSGLWLGEFAAIVLLCIGLCLILQKR